MNFGIYYTFIKLQNHSRVESEIAILEIAYTGHGFQCLFSRFSISHRCVGFIQCLFICGVQVS